jgi:serine acetyltransferase
MRGSGLAGLVVEDLRVNPDPKSRFIVVLYRVAHSASREGGRLRSLLRPAVLFLYRLIVECILGVEIPAATKVGRRLTIWHGVGTVIHAEASLGDDVLLRQGVTIGVAIEVPDRRAPVPVVGNRVTIGAGAAILGGVHIGDGVTIGANAVVLTDIPAGATAVGVPARVVVKR